MYIVSTNKKTIINTNNVTAYRLDDDEIYVKCSDTDFYTLGKYDTQHEVEQNFNRLMSFLRTGYENEIFYM